MGFWRKLLGLKKPSSAEKVEASSADLASINTRQISGNTPLHNVVYKGANELAASLRDACDSNHPDLVQALLDAGADVDARDNCGHTALILACYHESFPLAVIGALISKTNINFMSNFGQTALIVASREGRLDLVQALLQNGADPNRNLHSDFDPTALMAASSSGHLEVVKALIKGGAVVKGMYQGSTAEGMARKNGHAQVAAFLFERSVANPAEGDGTCGECGAPGRIQMKGRGVEVELGRKFATFPCSGCREPQQVPLEYIDKAKGLVAVCPLCEAASIIPPSVWCKSCGAGLSSGWQASVYRK